MHTLKQKKTKAKELKRRKTKQIANFFDEIDLGRYNEYIVEESFTEYLESIRRKSEYVQKQLITNGTDSLEFKMYCPYKIFCALVSQLTFDRISDVAFTSFEHYFKVNIKLKKRSDVELLIGQKTIANKELSNGFIEIKCSDLFPITLKYNTKSEYLLLQLDYGTKIRDKEDESKFHSDKPTKEIHLYSKRKEELEKRKRKVDQFIDNSNILNAVEMESSMESEITERDWLPGRPQRKRTKTQKLEEKQYIPKKILKKKFCEVEKENTYYTLWLNGEKTWQRRDDFIDFDEDGVEVLCEALLKFESQ